MYVVHKFLYSSPYFFFFFLLQCPIVLSRGK
uniref:Uncharacterized protein n=1 Tax=Rhizophora mucronata TaxID=61149 RepID=A0A2P2NXN7_RHIMU